MDARQAEPSMLDLPVYEELSGTAHINYGLNSLKRVIYRFFYREAL